MRVLRSWLKEHVDVGRLSPHQLAATLTMAGQEVTNVERLPKDEAIYELEITPNRPDCLSVRGLAREIHAITGGRLKEGQGARGEERGKSKRSPRPLSPAPRPLTIRIEDKKACRRYIGRVIEGVKVGPSPSWMAKRLEASGIRSINNVVDVTNYVLLEYGQPLHAFDYATITDDTIRVRRAQPNESLACLDEQTRQLQATQLVIADARRPVALAGVIGGTATQVTPRTTTMLLESAEFDPLVVRRSARAAGVSTESSYRFERGVDPGVVAAASERAAQLIMELAGGRVTRMVDAGRRPAPRATISFRLLRADAVLGTTVSAAQAVQWFKRLGCEVRRTGAVLHVRPPTARRDLIAEADLIEELARLIGYERLPQRLPLLKLDERPARQDHWHTVRRLRAMLTGLGLTEAVTYSLLSRAAVQPWAAEERALVGVRNPLSQEQAVVRPSLWPGLLQAAATNLRRGVAGVRLFEMGRVSERHEAGARERPVIGCVWAGLMPSDWRCKPASADLFHAKGALEQVLSRLGAGALQWRPAQRQGLVAGRTAEALRQDRVVAAIGEVSAPILAAADIPGPVVVAEVALDWMEEGSHPFVLAPVPKFPSSKRDVSLLVDSSVTHEAVLQVILEAGRPLLREAALFDRYAGPQVPAGRQSVAFALTYRHDERTLTDAEVDAAHQAVTAALQQQLHATIR